MLHAPAKRLQSCPCLEGRLSPVCSQLALPFLCRGSQLVFCCRLSPGLFPVPGPGVEVPDHSVAGGAAPDQAWKR